MDTFLTLSTQLGQLLAKKGYTLALAESCTGGLASAAITNVAGSSAWFDRSFVTYSNDAKQELLNVPLDVLNQHGAVSEQAAQAMATGALSNSKANIAASITGIAGPTGGTPEKPVGTVCFAYATREQVISTTKQFTGARQTVRQQSVVYLMNTLMDLINKRPSHEVITRTGILSLFSF